MRTTSRESACRSQSRLVRVPPLVQKPPKLANFAKVKSLRRLNSKGGFFFTTLYLQFQVMYTK